MDVDSGSKAVGTKKTGGRSRIEKRKVKKRSSILFPDKWADKKKKKR